MNTEIVKIDPKEFGLEETTATKIEQSFTPKIVEREGYVKVYENLLTKEINKSVCDEAGNLRKKLVKVRTGIADIHRVEKALYLASGRYVDALKNKHTLPIEQMEEKLAEIEKYYENQEKERIENLQKERESALSEFEVENVETLALGIMADQVWENFLAGTKAGYEKRKEDARIAEEKRLSDIEAEKSRIEAQRIENERLKKEAEEKDAKLKAEREAAEKAAKAASDKLESERKEAARLAKIEADKMAAMKAKADAELKAAKSAAEAAEKALKDKKDKEEKELAEKKAAEKRASNAPTKEKIKLAITSLTLELPKSDITDDVLAKFSGFKKWALSQSDLL